MTYKNANSVLPKELLEQIQQYVQGEYVYIPVKEKHNTEVPTDYKRELEKRDEHIYRMYLEGMDSKQLSQIHNLAESSIRRIIAQKRKGFTRMKEKIIQILGKWELQGSDIKQIYDTAWLIGDHYVLKIYHDSSMLERNLKILQILDDMDIPVGKIIPTKEKEAFAFCDGIFFLLTRKLPGNNIVRLGNDRKLALMMGEIIADLHLAFKRCEDMDPFWNNSLLEEMNGWVKNNLEISGWKYISKEEYERTVGQLARLYDDLPVQLIHRDVHFGNFLFSDGKFSGYIDFDLSQKNIRIFDICYFLLGLLSEKIKLEITEEIWFGFLKNVFRGYEKKLKLSEEEKRAVPYVMECIELLFVAYFAGADDIQCAENACSIYRFIKAQENRIWRCMRQNAVS